LKEKISVEKKTKAYSPKGDRQRRLHVEFKGGPNKRMGEIWEGRGTNQGSMQSREKKIGSS